MGDINSILTGWTVNFIRNRDLIFRKIVSLKEDVGKIQVFFKDKEQTYFIHPKLTFDIIFVEHTAIVCLNTQENFDFLVKFWDKFVALGKNLSIYFVNPYSNTEKKWILYPFTHNQIADKDCLSEGLTSMASNVEFTTIPEVEKIVQG